MKFDRKNSFWLAIAKENIQDIFSLDAAEAEEKMEKYWKQKDE